MLARDCGEDSGRGYVRARLRERACTHTHTHTHAAAFSVGNLKHRNLQGQEVCSQVLATLSRVA